MRVRPAYSRVGAQPGLTVLELLIVVVIIGIVATFVLVRFTDAREKAYVAAMMNDLRNYALAQYQYLADHGAWGTRDAIEAAGFMYSKDVFPDSANTTAESFYLRVKHRKTDRFCHLEIVSGSVSITEDRIMCEPITKSSNQAPIVSLSCPDTITRNTPYTCTASYSDPDGTVTSTSWGGLVTSAVFTSRSTPGSEQRSITVWDNLGASATATRTVNVVNLAPEASLMCPPTVPVGETFTCTVTAIDPEGDSWTTDWGTTSKDFSYDEPGQVFISVTVTDAYGAFDTKTQAVQIVAGQADNPPVAIFEQTELPVLSPDESTIIYTFKSYSYDPDGDELVLDWFVIPPEYDRGSYSDGDLFYVKIAAQPCGSDVTVTVLLTVRANGKRAESSMTTSADICHLPSVTQVAQRTQATPIISNHLETTP